MNSLLVSILLLQAGIAFAMPKEKEGKNFSGTSFQEYVGKLNPFNWGQTKADRLDAIFEVLDCIVENKEFSRCKMIVNKYEPLFQIEKKMPEGKVTEMPMVASSVAATQGTTTMAPVTTTGAPSA